MPESGESTPVSPLSLYLRPMRIADLPHIAALEAAIYSDPWSLESFADVVREDFWESVVAISEGNSGVATIIGYACWYLAADEFHIGNIAVDPGWRRKGIARQMLLHMFAVAGRSRAKKLFLEVRVSNEGARRFYLKHGFAEAYRRKGYYTDPPEDALVMWRPAELPEV